MPHQHVAVARDPAERQRSVRPVQFETPRTQWRQALAVGELVVERDERRELARAGLADEFASKIAVAIGPLDVGTGAAVIPGQQACSSRARSITRV